MFGHATIPFFILFVALTNLYLGYATAVILGWGPAARRPAKVAAVVPTPSLVTVPPSAPALAITCAAESTVAATKPVSPESMTVAVADDGKSPDTDELAPELLAAIQSAIDQEP